MFLFFFLTSSPSQAAEPALTVLAASSLTESLSAVAKAWTAKGNPTVTFSFDASSRLAKQIEAGAPADLYFSADTDWMTYLHDRGMIVPTSRVDLLGNRLVAVVPATSTLAVRAPADLGRPEIQHLALAAEAVPAGKYARAALLKLGVWEGVASRVVNGDNVRTVLGWVARGEAEAGVVYATDAQVEPKVKVAFPFPTDSYPPIVYPAAVLRDAPMLLDAAAFLGYCRTSEAREIFVAAGFTAL